MLAEQAIAARFQQGVSLFQAGRLPDAEMAFRDILRADPNHIYSLHFLGVIGHQTGHNGPAAELFARAVKLAPANAELQWGYGSVLHALGHTEAAIAAFRKALRLKPDVADWHWKLGTLLWGLQRAEEAVGCYEKARQLAPDNVRLHHELAMINMSLGRNAAALAGLREAVRLDPDTPEIHHDLAGALLQAGDLAEGWREYEWRWRITEFQDTWQRITTFRRQGCAQPEWDGSPLGGRRLLIHAEQGFGDAIQFSRFVPALARENDVILQARPPVLRLLESLPGGARLVSATEDPPPFDVYCSLMSLPGRLGITLANLPAEIPYLAADPTAVAQWQERLGGYAGLRVGLTWAGNTGYAIDSRRSMPVDRLPPLLDVPGVTFVSLQKGAPSHGPGLLDWTAELADFADTAALIGALDLVISVDTAVVHLAGALGKPAWLLNRFDSCWRWLLGRDDSPWYPTLRQFRQPRPGDWAGVIGRVRAALSQKASAGSADHSVSR